MKKENGSLVTLREIPPVSDHLVAKAAAPNRLADPPHLAQVTACGADAAALFALRRQWAQFVQTCALRSPVTPPSGTDFAAMTTTKGM